MNTIEFIKKIVDYINDHPNRDAMLSDMRMTYTNDFDVMRSIIDCGSLIDLDNDQHIWYREDELRVNGYIHEDDRLDVDITEIIDHVNRSEKNYTVIERSIL